LVRHQGLEPRAH